MSTRSYDDFFKQATGLGTPHAYQRELALLETPPAVLQVPTGAGKTNALILSWLYQRRVLGRGPRRLVYALPMRVLVEQTETVAREIRARLGLDDEELGIRVLMGGVEPDLVDWRRFPERDQILIGTIDMLLSRALNRGYGESRFAWPVSFGLLNADCRWVFDEVQLMGPARATSAQLDGLRRALGTALPCETIWASATVDDAALRTIDRPELGPVLTLPEEDRAGNLARSLNAVKRLVRIEVPAKPGDYTKAVTRAVTEHHRPGTRTLVVVNTVERARAVYAALGQAFEKDGPPVVLVHSRFRPRDRAERMRQVTELDPDAGTVVVATQVVEAGLDISSRTLITEPAPFSSIVQRLGRCNRYGEHEEEATVCWLDPGETAQRGRKGWTPAPYEAEDVARTREKLLELEGESLSPVALESIRVEESPDDPTVLRRQDLLDLFDTSPDISGLDIDIAPFIRADDERTVSVFFRELGEQRPARIDDQELPGRDELVEVPIGDLKDRACWAVDHIDGSWVRVRDGRVVPGITVMLAAEDGGYDDTGWNPASETPVVPERPEATTAVQSLASDRHGDPQELLEHLEAVVREVDGLVTALGLDAWRDALTAAAAVHDLGKAHPVFQEMLVDGIDPERFPDREQRLWAKSGRSGGRTRRRYFRHELASALALTVLDGELRLPRPELVRYLVAAHHGKVRLSIRPAPGETRPDDAPETARFALGLVDGDKILEATTPLGTVPSVTLTLSPMEVGSDTSWTDRAVGLRDDPQLGPFRLGFLEALLRVADWRASA